MNRANRRKKTEKEGRVNPNTLLEGISKSDTLEQYIEEEVERRLAATRDELFARFIFVMAKALNTRFGFGKRRLERALTGVQSFLYDLNLGKENILELEEWLKNKYKIEIALRYR